MQRAPAQHCAAGIGAAPARADITVCQSTEGGHDRSGPAFFSRAAGSRGQPSHSASAGSSCSALLDASYFTVGQNERAYVRIFGRVQNPSAGPIGPGLHAKFPLFTDVDRISVSLDVMDLGNMETFTRDAQRITMHVTVTTQVPDAAVYHLLYEVGRAGNLDLERNYQTIIADRLRTVIGRHDINEVAGAERQQIIDEARAVLSRDLAQPVRHQGR